MSEEMKLPDLAQRLRWHADAFEDADPLVYSAKIRDLREAAAALAATAPADEPVAHYADVPLGPVGVGYIGAHPSAGIRSEWMPIETAPFWAVVSVHGRCRVVHVERYEILRAIATTLRAQLAEAQREIERLQTIEFVDEWGVKQTLTREAAANELRAWENEWPGGLEEIKSSINGFKRGAEAATARADANEKDARRYRHLRGGADLLPLFPVNEQDIHTGEYWGELCNMLAGEELDAAIDDALAQS